MRPLSLLHSCASACLLPCCLHPSGRECDSGPDSAAPGVATGRARTDVRLPPASFVAAAVASPVRATGTFSSSAATTLVAPSSPGVGAAYAAAVLGAALAVAQHARAGVPLHAAADLTPADALLSAALFGPHVEAALAATLARLRLRAPWS
jgi:hypothetical protein